MATFASLTRIRMRAEIRVGELLAEMAERGERRIRVPHQDQRLGGVDTYRIHKMMAARVTTAR